MDIASITVGPPDADSFDADDGGEEEGEEEEEGGASGDEAAAAMRSAAPAGSTHTRSIKRTRQRFIAEE
jgi:hypothetical protein